LVIDDETNVRRMIRMALEANGYEVEEAASGASGLDIYADGSYFDAVILDQKMPGMDGLETLKRLRLRTPDAAVVMATAYGSIELAVDAMKAGATDFLKKPLTPEMLRGAVAAALAKRPPRAAPPSAAEPAIPADVWTVNGFFIRAVPAGHLDEANQHRFVVRHAGKGPEGEVVVFITEAVLARVARQIGRALPPDKAFWQQEAERALMNYLFREATLPPEQRLVIDRLSDETILRAREWPGK
jgi:DNA-binding response OmpR family regulator